MNKDKRARLEAQGWRVGTAEDFLGQRPASVNVENRIAQVEVTNEMITARLTDGRVISVPLAWSWRLSEATPAQRTNWELIGDGYGVHWPDVDEDISAEGMLYGVPAHRPSGTRPTHARPADQATQAARTSRPTQRRRASRH